VRAWPKSNPKSRVNPKQRNNMLVMTGKLRQWSPTEFEGKKKTKLWVETFTPGEGGRPDDLKMHELFLEGDHGSELPAKDGAVSVLVRPYAVGREVKFACAGLVPVPAPQIRKA